jgi:hypothetical protein
MSEADFRTAQAAAEDSENRRRELASQTPGLGALVSLPENPNGPGTGIWDLGLPVTGESHQAAPYVEQRKSYGPPSPVYADPLVGGPGYAPGGIETALRHVTDLGADGLFIEGASAPAADPFMVVSPPARPGLLARLRGCCAGASERPRPLWSGDRGAPSSLLGRGAVTRLGRGPAQRRGRTQSFVHAF